MARVIYLVVYPAERASVRDSTKKMIKRRNEGSLLYSSLEPYTFKNTGQEPHASTSVTFLIIVTVLFLPDIQCETPLPE